MVCGSVASLILISVYPRAALRMIAGIPYPSEDTVVPKIHKCTIMCAVIIILHILYSGRTRTAWLPHLFKSMSESSRSSSRSIALFGHAISTLINQLN